MNKLIVKEQRIFDENVGEILLNGINLVCKDKTLGYVTNCGEELFSWFEKQGFNVLRMGLIWDGVEPVQGEFDDFYLSKIKEQIAWAEKHNIYVFLDMHQDLYSVSYGDGAPEWATLSNSAPHIVGEVWSDAYLASPAVINSIDAFWSNTPVNGKGLIDCFFDMWKHCAEFFSDCENIIGYDVYNEPFPGSSGSEVMGAIISGYSMKVLGDTEKTPQELAAMWFSQEQKQGMLRSLEDMSVYSKLTEYAKAISQDYEKQKLNRFYTKLEKAVKTATNGKIMMLETSYFSNMGIESGIEADFSSPAIFSPHGYDLVVDTNHYEIYNKERVKFIFEAHRRVQERLNIPVLVGEWGAFSQNPITPSLVKLHIEIFEKYLWSNTYWCWHENMENLCFAPYLCRAYPMRTGGKLISYHYDYDTQMLTMQYQSDGSPCRIFHPRHGVVVISRPIGKAQIALN